MRSRLVLPLVAALAALAVSFAFPPATAVAAVVKPASYTVDPVHSTVIFRCSHLGTSIAFGRFDKIEGAFAFDAEKPESSTVSIKIDAKSVNTNNKDRDDHLRGPDFLDVEQFPAATFQSTAVKKKADKVFTVTGDLTLHGVKKSVTFDMEHIGSTDHPIAGSISGFYGELEIQRADYGVSYGDGMLGKSVKLLLSVEGQKSDKK